MANINIAHRLRIPALPWRVALLFIGLMTVGAYTQSPEPATQTLSAFENTTQDYVRMHRRLESQIGSIKLGTPVNEINRLIQELAAAIRAERTGAKQGDFFTPALTHMLRARIDDALVEHGFTADDVRAAGRVDWVDYARVRLEVNGTFPWLLAAAMFPCVLEALPALPPELQYRFVGDDLVLIDVHASVVVDFLPSALADVNVRAIAMEGVTQ